MKFPDGVIDKKAYIKYIKLDRHPILNEAMIFKASDGEDINLAWFPHFLKKKIEHLPDNEQEDILIMKDTYSSINNNATVQKRLAFGLKQGRGATKDGTPSLLDLRGTEIIDYFGRMFTTAEVLKVINKDWGIKFNSIKKLQEFRKQHSKEIEAAIERYKASYSDIRLGVKRSRLEEYTYLYGQQKTKYEDSKSNDSYRLLLQTLESIRKESEGDRLTIEGKIDVTYESNLQQHLRNEIFRTMNLKEVILGRVAARMGVSPVKLIYSLNSSYYKRFSNVLGDFDPVEAEGDAIYPSQMNYDFERIGKAQKALDRNVEEAVLIDAKEDEEKDGDRANDIKAKMLAKLKAKQSKLGKGQADLNVDTKNKNGK